MDADLQDALAALATDPALRERFAHEGAAALAAFALSEAERAALLAVGAEAIDEFARGLVAKRAGELLRALPLSRRVAPSITRRCRPLLACTPLRFDGGALPPGVRDALLVGPALAAALASDGSEAPWAADLLRLEALAGASRGDGMVRTATLAFDLREALADLRAGLIPVEVPAAPTRVRLRADGIDWSRP